MDTTSLIMIALALMFLAVVRWKSPESAARGLGGAIALIIEVTPRIMAAFLIAGLIQAVVPQEIIVRWMGRESGFKGIFIATALGSVTPGGPMLHFPIVASLFRQGVSIGPLVAYLTAWSLLGFQRIIMWELPFLGVEVVTVRVVASLFFPLLAGWLSHFVWLKFHY